MRIDRANIRRRNAQAIVVAVLSVHCGATVVQANTQIIAIAGDTAPDGNGVFFSFDRFREPALNDAGQVAFWGSLTGTSGGTTDNEGVFRGAGGPITQIARRGQTAPDGNGLCEYLGGQMLNDAGQVAFWSVLSNTSGGTDDDGGVFLGAGGVISQIAREGQAALDGDGTVRSVGHVGLNDAGQVLLDATITGASAGPDYDSVLVAAGGPMTEIVRSGQPTPDGNGVFGPGFTPVINDAGDVAFWDFPYSSITNNGGIYIGSGGPVAQIAFAEQPAPDGNGVFFGAGAWTVAVNEAAHVSFWASFQDTSGEVYDEEGIFVGTPGLITQVARAGQAAPDGNGILSWVEAPTLNNAGQVAFAAGLDDTNGGASDNYGIFLGTGGPLTQLVRTGEPAPDGNGTYSDFVGIPILNDAGQMAFVGRLSNTSGGSVDNLGIFLADGDDILQVARHGQSLAGSIITGLQLGQFADEANGLNNAGQVAYWAQLADGREVIALWTPPLAGDFNFDGVVDAADYVVWRKTNSGDPLSYEEWSNNFNPTPAGAGGSTADVAAQSGVPEPAAAILLLSGLIAVAATRRR